MRYLILACLAAIAGGTLLVLIEPAAGSEEDAVPVGVMEKEGSMPGTWEWLDVVCWDLSPLYSPFPLPPTSSPSSSHSHIC